MIINLSPFINSSDKTFHFEGALDTNNSGYIIEDYNILFPIDYSGDIYQVEDELILNLNIEYSYETNCSRCLVDVENKIADTSEIYLVSDEQEVDDNNDIKNFFVVDNDLNLNLDDLIISQVITSIPFSVICKEDCQGLCSTCGSNLNEGQCDCVEDTSTNPFESLQNMFKEDEEV